MKGAQALQEPQIPRHVALAETAKHAERGREQGQYALRPVLVDLSTPVFLLGVMDTSMPRALERPRAAGRVGGEPTARSAGAGRRRLHRLHRASAGRVEDDSPLAPAPGDTRGPVWLVGPPTGLALLAAPTGAASPRLLPALLRLPLVPSGGREGVGCTPILGCPSLAIRQLYLEAVRPMELAEFFRQEPTHHLRPHNEFSQPMAYREEPFRLVRRHPLACCVFLTESYLLHFSDRAAIVYPHHFLLWTNTPAIEVGRADDKLDLYCLPKLFQGFPTQGLRKAFALFDAPRHALPLPCGKVLLFRALEEKVPAVRLAPHECTNHCTKTTHSH